MATYEVEITSSVSPTNLFNAIYDFHNIAHKVDPETYKSFELVHGDGRVGTIKNFTFADGFPFKGGKLKVDVVDKDNLTLGYTIFEGDALMGLLESGAHIIKFTPCADGGCVYKHSVVYKYKGDTQASEDHLNLAKAGITKSFKGVEAYVKANPGVY